MSATTLSKEQQQALDTKGFEVIDFGGLPKNIYWTPDGRIKRAIPQMREYVLKDKDGKVTGQGTRDANLDNGWLTTKPTVLKPYCKGCDRWHDTQAEVTACIKRQKAYLARMEALARKELRADQQAKDTQIENLSKKVEELTALVEKMAGAKA